MGAMAKFILRTRSNREDVIESDFKSDRTDRKGWVGIRHSEHKEVSLASELEIRSRRISSELSET
jgi:hypothetical protein